MASDQTLPATPAKRLQARREGRVVKSRQLVTATLLLGSTILLQWQASPVQRDLQELWQNLWRQPRNIDEPLSAISAQWTTADFWLQTAIPVLVSLAPLITGVLTLALLGSLLQTGVIFTPNQLTPNTNRLNPNRWWQRITSAAYQAEVVGSMLRSVIILSVTAITLWSLREDIAILSVLPARQLTSSGIEVLTQILIQIGLVYLAFGSLDYFWQRSKLEKSLRMTPEELRQEQKQRTLQPRQPSPKKTSAERKILRQTLANAAIVVYTPGGAVVAIAYDPLQMDVPRIQKIWRKESQQNPTQEEVLSTARTVGIDCVQHHRLTTLIASTLQSGQQIPPPLYQEVANLFR
ncbi:MAG TPA: hypothetical protein DEP12_12090 [Planctomycetaceae bacterium]|nr:hypothetical protein [Planctomycetaceae bacterium]